MNRHSKRGFVGAGAAALVAASALACPPANPPGGPADWNGDGRVNCFDLEAYWHDFELGDSCTNLDDGSGLGVPDIFVDMNDWTYYAYRLYPANQQALPCGVLDWDGDGDVDCADVTGFLAAWLDGDQCTDIDGGTLSGLPDGISTPEDLAYFINQLETRPGCNRVVSGDRCINPVNLGSALGVYPFNNCAAMTEAQTPVYAANAGCSTGLPGGPAIRRDTWYQFRVPGACPLTISTVGLTALDTRLAVYTTQCPTSIAQAIACNDDFGGTPQSSVTFTAVANRVYYIQLGVPPTTPPAISTLGGSGMISISTASNDLCANALPVAFPAFEGQTVYVDYNDACAGTDGPRHTGCHPSAATNYQLERDLWYLLTAPVNLGVPSVTLQAVNCSLQGDLIAVYEYFGNCTSPAPVLIGCDDGDGNLLPSLNNCPGGTIAVTFTAVAGHTYLIRIGKNSFSSAGPGTLYIERPYAGAACALPTLTRAYKVVGCGNGQAWSWKLTTPTRTLGISSVAGVSTPQAPTPACPANTARATAVVGKFITSLAQVVQAAGCNNRIVVQGLSQACQAGQIPGVNCAWFSIQAAGPFELYVGPPNNPNCRVVSGNVAQPCVFNPQIEEVPLAELDGNSNGISDQTEIAAGLLIDADGDGIADEFQSPCCAADFNGSGAVSVQDLFDFLAAYFGGDPLADFNGNEELSVQDLFDFLAAYFGGCG